MAAQRGAFAAGGGVPKLDRVILAAGCQRFAVGRKGHGIHRATMSGQRQPLLAAVHVPEDDLAGAVEHAADRGQRPAVGREGDVLHPVMVAFQDRRSLFPRLVEGRHAQAHDQHVDAGKDTREQFDVAHGFVPIRGWRDCVSLSPRSAGRAIRTLRRWQAVEAAALQPHET